MQLNPVNFSPEQLVKLSVEGLRLQAEKKGLAISCEFQNADKDNIWGKYSEVMTSASDRCWTTW